MKASDTINRIFWIGGPVILMLLLTSGMATAEVTLNILHVNDTHSHIESDKQGNYGYARLKTAVDSIRNIPGQHTLFIHCGDMFPGTLFYNIYHGRSDIKAFNMMGLDVHVLGNHEFDGGVDSLAAVLPLSGAVTVASNLANLPGKLEKYVRTYAVKEYGPVKVGIIGMVTNTTPDISSPGDIRFMDYVQVVNQKAAALKSIGCDYIILAAHLGKDECFNLIANTTGIDLCLDGHFHILEDMVVPNRVGKQVRYRQASAHAHYLGVYTVNFDDNGNLLPDHYNNVMLELDNTIPENPEMLDSLKVWSAPLEEYASHVAGYISADLDYDYPAIRERDIPLANLVADAFLWYGKKYGADVAIINSGGIRESLKGPEVTYKDIYSVLPFDNTLDVLTVDGITMRKIVTLAVMRAKHGESGCFPQVAGIKYGYDYGVHMLRSLMIKSGDEYVMIVPGQKYKIATNSYMAHGGDGYRLMSEVNDSDRMSGIASQQQVLADYLSTHSSKKKPLDITELYTARINVIE